MMNIAFSIVSFVVLKWAFLKLFKTPQSTDAKMLQLPHSNRKSSSQLGI